jgi:hypothetical protein
MIIACGEEATKSIQPELPTFTEPEAAYVHRIAEVHPETFKSSSQFHNK